MFKTKPFDLTTSLFCHASFLLPAKKQLKKCVLLLSNETRTRQWVLYCWLYIIRSKNLFYLLELFYSVLVLRNSCPITDRQTKHAAKNLTAIHHRSIISPPHRYNRIISLGTFLQFCGPSRVKRQWCHASSHPHTQSSVNLTPCLWRASSMCDFMSVSGRPHQTQKPKRLQST